jgi:hypothetical protein
LNYVGLIFALGLAGLGILLADRFASWNKMQTCVTAGRKNCGDQPPPIESNATIWVPSRRAP